MKILTKKSAIRIIIALVVISIGLAIYYRPVYYHWRVWKKIRAIWDDQYGGNNHYRWQWESFGELAKLAKIDSHASARTILDIAYSLKSPKSRLKTSHEVGILLDIYANYLRAIPENSVYVSNGDNDTYPVWFLQKVENIRPDVILINRHLWRLPEYRLYLWKTTPIKEVISREEILQLPDTTINEEKYVVLTPILRKLAKNRSIFLTGCLPPEFPEDSLYFVPVPAKMFLPAPLPDSVYAHLLWKMLNRQNWNLIAEHPPFYTKRAYINTGAVNLPSILINTAYRLSEMGEDSLADNLLQKFDKWLRWNPFYLLVRAKLEYSLSEPGTKIDVFPWLDEVENWLTENYGHWFYPQIDQLYDSLKTEPNEKKSGGASKNSATLPGSRRQRK
ncbi:hypothetical protein DRQ33_02995 [bacterium]|nr:MAG: hypothetical protein DRQ33_02995 [bacterium]